MIDKLASEDGGIKSVVVLEKGEVVLNYNRDDNAVPFRIESQTKAIMSLIMGKLIEDERYDLTLDTTLGEIFQKDSDWTGAPWGDVEDVEERKTITVSTLWCMNVQCLCLMRRSISF